MSRKAMGATTTKPPAVMGRDFASLRGAWAPPVDMPEGFVGAGDCGVCGFERGGRCSNAAGAVNKTRRSEAKKAVSQFGECVLICRLPVREDRRRGRFGRRGRSSAFEECRWANGCRWVSR